MSGKVFGAFSGIARASNGRTKHRVPLIVAIHGGSYRSAYFD